MKGKSFGFVFAGIALFSLSSIAYGGIEDFYFRYDFSKGTKVYEHNGCEVEPCTTYASYNSVYGTNGYSTAVHPDGWGTIADGDAKLNADWTLAMSLKSTDVNKGVLLSLGTNVDVGDKQVLFCSSDEAGKLHIAICQRWAQGSINIPTSITLSNLGDTTNSFHSLVAVHTISDNIIKFYWDGQPVGSWDSNAHQGDKLFASGFQFGSAHGGNPSGYVSGDFSVAFQDIRFFTRALSAEEAGLYAQSYPAARVHLDDYFFSYDFTSGMREFTGNDGFDPAGSYQENVSVNGPEGENKAVHPKGFGNISDGDVKLNEDWTVAMSVKPDDVAKGILLCLGSNETFGKKQFLICSGEEGTIHAAVCQRWSSNTSTSNYKNFPAYSTYGGLGETSARFHSIVAVHKKGDKATGVVTLYFDGKQIGTLDTSYGSDTRPFVNGFQFCHAHGGITGYMGQEGYASMENNDHVAFLDVRFYTNLWTQAEAKLYSQQYPPSYPYGVNEMTWTNAAGDGSFENVANWSLGKLPSAGDLITIEAPVDVEISIGQAYSFNSLTISGEGCVSFSGDGSVQIKELNVLTGASVVINDIVNASTVMLQSESSAVVTGERGPSSMALSGSGTFYLDPGAGKTYTMSGSNVGYEGEAVVASGTVKFGDSTSFGVNGRSAFIRVKSGATLDENGKTDGGQLEKNKVILEEGANFTSNPGFGDTKLPPVTRLKLEGNANVVADSGLVSISRHFNNGNTYIELDEFTLTKTGAYDFFISSCRISGTGKLYVQEGTLIVTHEYYGNSPGSCADGTIQIAEGATFRMANYYGRPSIFSVKNLILDGRLIRDEGQPHELTVTGSITGSGTAQMLKLAEGAVIKPNGKDCLTISEELVGTLVFDLSDLDFSEVRGALPLIMVGSQELLPVSEQIVFTGGKPKGWELVAAKTGFGYQLKQSGMRVIVR